MFSDPLGIVLWGGFDTGTVESFLLTVEGVLPLVSSASAISKSVTPPLLSCLRLRLGGAVAVRLCVVFAVLAALAACVLGGPGAIGTTPPDLEAPGVAVAPFALVAPAPTDPVDLGDSESRLAFPEVGVVTGVCAIEFFREDFFEDRVDAEPTGAEFPLPRFRFLITSVLSESGRTTPCSLRNKPHALHKGWPSGLRRQRGVV